MTWFASPCSESATNWNNILIINALLYTKDARGERTKKFTRKKKMCGYVFYIVRRRKPAASVSLFSPSFGLFHVSSVTLRSAVAFCWNAEKRRKPTKSVSRVCTSDVPAKLKFDLHSVTHIFVCFVLTTTNLSRSQYAIHRFLIENW